MFENWDISTHYVVPLCCTQGKSRTEAWQSVKSVYWSALVKNWIIWGIAQYINMSYVPFKVCVVHTCTVHVCVHG